MSTRIAQLPQHTVILLAVSRAISFTSSCHNSQRVPAFKPIKGKVRNSQHNRTLHRSDLKDSPFPININNKSCSYLKPSLPTTISILPLDTKWDPPTPLEDYVWPWLTTMGVNFQVRSYSWKKGMQKVGIPHLFFEISACPHLVTDTEPDRGMQQEIRYRACPQGASRLNVKPNNYNPMLWESYKWDIHTWLI